MLLLQGDREIIFTFNSELKEENRPNARDR